MTHAQEEVQLKDIEMHEVCNGIQYKHKEWTFSHKKFSPQKDSLSLIYTEANRDQMHESINKFDWTAQWAVLYWYCEVSWFKNAFTFSSFT